MLPSRYTVVDERSPYPVKRRVRGRGEDRGSDSAITLLPPDPYLIMEKPDFGLSRSPTVYRTTAPKSAKNKEASSFVILGEVVKTPVQSRPGSPSGRVSPFRGHGFKSPATTRPNSRAPSPSDSPKKSLKSAKSGKAPDRARVGRDIGLPPKSPMKSQAPNKVTKQGGAATTGVAAEKPETNDGEGKAESEAKCTKAEEEKGEAEAGADFAAETNKHVETTANDAQPDISGVSESSEGKKSNKTAEQPPKEPPLTGKTKPRSTLTTPGGKKPPVSPTPKSRTKAEKAQQPAIKRPTKPPVAPKKFGLKTSLIAEENGKDQERKGKKEGIKGKDEGSGECQQQTEEKKRKDDARGELEQNKEVQATKPPDSDEKGNESGKAPPQETPKPTSGPDAPPLRNPLTGETKPPGDKKEDKPQMAAEKPDKKSQKLIPCFQPDKCQIAPPTMASPSPIITPTISTPSMTSDLASSSIKNSQSIAAAPTAVTPSSLGSVSSTVVLTGNLARRQIDTRTKPKDPDAANAAPPENPLQPHMVKAATKDAVTWSKKDSLSGEVTSTKMIKADPDMEVLSPNNLRGSPPRMPPPNLAWDEGRSLGNPPKEEAVTR